MNNLYTDLIGKIIQKEWVVLATIIQTQGSAPQIPGVSALFSKDGLFRGTLGGGILEATAQREALAALEDEKSRILDFDLTSENMSAEEAICGGTAKVLLDASPQRHFDVFQRLLQSREKRASGVLATSISLIRDNTVDIKREWIEEASMRNIDLDAPFTSHRDEMQKTLSENGPVLLRTGENMLPEECSGRWLFLEPAVPSPRLVIAGAGHVGQAVAHLGRLLQFEVTVIDDRAEFANKARIPDADSIIVDDIPRAVAGFPIGQDTYIVIVTRGHTYDTETLRSCISSQAAYIGMIGSRRKVRLIRENFIKKGWSSAEEFDRIFTPIGLEIYSKTVEEIAISIAAQLVLVRGEKKKKEEDTK